MSTSQILLLMAALAGAGFVALLLWVNGRVRRYRGSITLDVPVVTAWDLLTVQPGRPSPVPWITAAAWVDEAAPGEGAVMHAADGTEIWIRSVEAKPPQFSHDEITFREPGRTAFGDLMHFRQTLAPADPASSRTRVAVDFVIERRGPASLAALSRRLRYPFLVVTAGVLVREHIAALRGSGELPPAPPEAPARPDAAAERWIGPALAGAAVIWLAATFGVALGLALLIGLVVHESGHVWSMRRRGHGRSRFYLIPFFGGLAVSDAAFRSDAEAAEITLMGPAFGVLPGLGALLAHAGTGDPWFAAAGAALLGVNGFNLLPVPPLDGGQAARLLLRPLGPRIWFAGSGLLILLGSIAAAALSAPDLLVTVALGAVVWSAAPAPPASVAPLDPRGAAGVAAAYAGLMALHAAALAYAVDRLDWTDWADYLDLLANGPFAA